MRKKLKQFMVSIMITLGVLMPVMPAVVSAPAVALAPAETMALQTNLFGDVTIDDEGSGITRLLLLIVKILLYGIGAAAVIGVVIAGILYLTARDNEAQVARAKTRLIEVAIGLVAWAMLFTLLQWLIPGFDGTELQ